MSGFFEWRVLRIGFVAFLWVSVCGAGVAQQPPVRASPAPRSRVNPKDQLTYVYIPAGSFKMGCSPGDTDCASYELPVHRVAITKGFWLSQTPVTQAAYRRVTRNNPSHFKGDNRPVESVTWHDAVEYCRMIGGRLPTEAEWEYAARAGTAGARYGNLAEIAWYDGNSGDQTHDVGQKKPNAWGLYDMLGNVGQWTADWYGKYSAGDQTDPQGPSDGKYRTLRGSFWAGKPQLVRVSNRVDVNPDESYESHGFRCVAEVSHNR
jgi:formylglycine-generating enzyme required for sulfatase activity